MLNPVLLYIGSQQYTARNLNFNGCKTAVQMIWDWGWTWQAIQISDVIIGFNISAYGGSNGVEPIDKSHQGTGSISIIGQFLYCKHSTLSLLTSIN
jgi:hypothetical protein